jgi:2'-5' RNA ligase
MLVRSFQNFSYNIQSNVEKKNNFKKALLDQTMKILGEVSEDNILNKNLDEIWNIILAVPFDRGGKYGKELSTTILRDLNKVSDKVFDNFINDFEIKIRAFKVDRFRDYSFETGNQIFYWIPLSRFPGND